MAAVAVARRPAPQPPRPCRGRHAGTGRRTGPPGLLALHAGQQSGRPARHQRIRAATGEPGQRPAGVAVDREFLPKMQGAARTGSGRVPNLHARNRDAAIDVDAVSPVALRQAVQNAIAGRISARPGIDRGNAGRPLPDDAADGQRADPVPERPADRLGAGRTLPRRPARRLAAGLDSRLAAHLHPGAGFGAHRPRPADDDLRAPARPVARIFRRQADR